MNISMNRVGRRRRWHILICTIYMVLILTACGKGTGSGVGAEYQGVKYTGHGSLETMVAVAIHNEEEMLFVQFVKVIDDQPTVWKALKAISDNEDQGVSIEKDQEGHIIKVGNQGNDELVKWTLSLDNIPEEGDVEELNIEEDETISLSYVAQ